MPARRRLHAAHALRAGHEPDQARHRRHQPAHAPSVRHRREHRQHPGRMRRPRDPRDRPRRQRGPAHRQDAGPHARIRRLRAAVAGVSARGGGRPGRLREPPALARPDRRGEGPRGHGGLRAEIARPGGRTGRPGDDGRRRRSRADRMGPRPGARRRARGGTRSRRHARGRLRQRLGGRRRGSGAPDRPRLHGDLRALQRLGRGGLRQPARDPAQRHREAGDGLRHEPPLASGRRRTPNCSTRISSSGSRRSETRPR